MTIGRRLVTAGRCFKDSDRIPLQDTILSIPYKVLTVSAWSIKAPGPLSLNLYYGLGLLPISLNVHRLGKAPDLMRTDPRQTFADKTRKSYFWVSDSCNFKVTGSITFFAYGARVPAKPGLASRFVTLLQS